MKLILVIFCCLLQACIFPAKNSLEGRWQYQDKEIILNGDSYVLKQGKIIYEGRYHLHPSGELNLFVPNSFIENNTMLFLSDDHATITIRTVKNKELKFQFQNK